MSQIVKSCFVTATLAASLFSCQGTSAQESRIWTSKGGKHEIRAKLVDVVDGKARLERPNGDISRIALEKLSDADQQYIEGYLAGQKPQQPTSPGKPDKVGLAIGDRVEAQDFREWKNAVVVDIDYEWERVEVRFDGDRGRTRDLRLNRIRLPGTSQQPLLVEPREEPQGGIVPIRPDLSDVGRPVPSGGDTSVASDPAAVVPSGWTPKPVRLQGRTNVHESPKDFSISATGEPIAMVVHQAPGFGDADPSRIEILDLRKKKVLFGGPALPETEMVEFSPSGKRVVTMAVESGSDSKGQLDFWSVDGKQVDHVVSFSPYVMNTWPDVQPEWFAWLDDERFFTVNREGQLLLWQLEGAKAIYELMIDRGAVPALSPGKRQLAVPTVAGVQIFDTQNGELLATVGSGNLRYASLAFSPSGRQLAAVSSGFVDVMDVTTGEVTRSFSCKDISHTTTASWIDEEFLFSSSGLLVHVPKRLVAWKFEVSNNLIKSYAGTPWILLDSRAGNSQILSPMELPPPEAAQAIADLPDEQLLAVQPGETVSIDVKIRDRALAPAVEQALTAALEEAGMQVGDNAELTLSATMKHGEREKVNYRGFHDHFGKGESFEVTKRVYELQLLLNGTPIWKRTSVQSPQHHIRMQEGENIRSAVARVMQPTAANFRGRLPAYVVRPEYQEPFGTSRVGPGN